MAHEINNMFVTVCLYLVIASTSYLETDLVEFSNTIDGEVIRATDSGYEDSRQQFDPSLSKFPSVIIKCNTIQDVRKSVQFALDFDEEFVVRSGAHSTAGYSTCNGCIMIDLRMVNDIIIKEDTETFPSVIVSPGVKVNELAYALEFTSESGKKYWIPAGLNNVGVGGHVHGGGWGFGIRKHGLVTDNLIEAKVIIVSANGAGKQKAKVVIADEYQNEDLFFCIRGVIGPSCGIVVEYELKIYEQNSGGYSFGAITSIGSSLDFYARLDRITVVNASVSDQRTHGMIVSHLKPPFTNYIASRVTWSFYDGDVSTDSLNFANHLVDEISTNLGGYVAELRHYVGGYTFFRCMMEGYNETECQTHSILSTMNSYHTESPRTLQSAHWLYDSESEWDQFVASGGYALIVNEIFTTCPTYSMCGWYVSAWGGKMNQVAPTATGFAHRDTQFDLVIMDYFLNPLEFNLNVEWVRKLFVDKLYNSGLTTKRGYTNYAVYGLSEADSFSFYYGNNQNELINSKCNWDPNDIFTHPQGIPVESCKNVNAQANLISMEKGSLAMYSTLLVVGMVALFALCVCGYCFWQKKKSAAAKDMKHLQDNSGQTFPTMTDASSKEMVNVTDIGQESDVVEI